ncbi:Hypothetical predicted protein [Pelobates cultripes]|uniref:Uncharacterized protein n=1 Tax=Pelobates cultripes TaxID=61616 RepID=A0AAD1SSL0_PELCU|nr:Hypothetical predicted protein [Pelobates cultripes]
MTRRINCLTANPEVRQRHRECGGEGARAVVDRRKRFDWVKEALGAWKESW